MWVQTVDLGVVDFEDSAKFNISTIFKSFSFHLES